MVRGRRTRAALSIFDHKRDGSCSPSPKRLFAGFNGYNLCDSTMTRRSAKILNANKLPTSFHDQTITKYFHVQQKIDEDQTINEKSFSFTSVHDNDENACDPFTAALKMPTYQTFEDLCNMGKTEFSTNHDNNVTDIMCTAADHDLPFAEIATAQTNNFTNGNDVDNESHDESDSSSATSIEPSNIFLQKPVLHLNIDKSPNQASSIVINKHLEVCPNFTSTLNSLTNIMVSKSMSSDSSIGNSSETPSSADDAKENEDDENGKKAKKTSKRRKLIKTRSSNHFDALLESDGNSCDSGVVVDRSLEMNAGTDNKPTTPHRILCPSISPVKKLKPERSAKVSALQNVRSSLLGHRAAGRVSALKRATTAIQKRQLTRMVNENNNLLKFAIKTSSTNTPSNTCVDQSNIEEQKISEAVESTPLIENCAKTVSTSPPPSAMAKRKKSKQQLTDYFPVRRSFRKTKREREQENLRDIEKAIEKQSEDGLAVKIFKDKGRGIVANRSFTRGEFVVEYIGDLIDHNEADRREEVYAKDAEFGCYMYYFKHKEQHWCIDATAETGKLGRLVNHSRNGNLMTKIVTYKNYPHLVLIAKDNINKGEELTYDYGDRTRQSIANYPWLAL